MLKIGVIIGCTLLAACVSTANFDKARAAQARLRLAIAYLHENELSLAYKNLRKAVEYAPRDSQIQLGMALYEQQTEQFQAANTRYKKLLKNEKSSTVLNQYGLFLCTIGEYAEAEKQYRKALMQPDFLLIADTLKNSGYCALQAGNVALAEQAFKNMVTHDLTTGKTLLLM